MGTRINTTVCIWDKVRKDWVTLPATIDVDSEIIGRELAVKAFKNKSKASKLAAGGVVLTIVTPKE